MIVFAQFRLPLIEDSTSVANSLLPWAIEAGVNVVLALLLLVLGWWLAGFAAHLTRRTLRKTDAVDATLIPLLASFCRYGIIAITAIAVLNQFGFQTATLTAALTTVLAAIALGLQGALGNLAAGIMLVVLRPFSIGDFIEINNTLGTVEEIGIFATVLTAPEGLWVSMPNGILLNNKIVNFTRNPSRQLDLDVGVSYDSDLELATQALLQIAEQCSLLLLEPQPQVLVLNYGDSTITLRLRVMTQPQLWWESRCQLMAAIKPALDRVGIDMPFPQRVMHWQPSPNAINSSSNGA